MEDQTREALRKIKELAWDLMTEEERIETGKRFLNQHYGKSVLSDSAVIHKMSKLDIQKFKEEWEKFEAGEMSIVSLESEVTILKEKKGVPTVIQWQGKKYILHHSDQFKR